MAAIGAPADRVLLRAAEEVTRPGRSNRKTRLSDDYFRIDLLLDAAAAALVVCTRPRHGGMSRASGLMLPSANNSGQSHETLGARLKRRAAV